MTQTELMKKALAENAAKAKTKTPAPPPPKPKPAKRPPAQPAEPTADSQTASKPTVRDQPPTPGSRTSLKKPHKGQKAPGRLPDESHISVRYDAAAQTWTGTLTIQLPTNAMGKLVQFSASKSGLFRLVASELDMLYRQWYYRTFGERSPEHPDLAAAFAKKAAGPQPVDNVANRPEG